MSMNSTEQIQSFDELDSETLPARQQSGQYPETTKQQCLDEYLFTNKSMEDIARANGVPPGTLRYWHYTYKWREKRQALAKDLEERHGHEIRAVIHENAGKIVRRHVALTEKFDANIMRTLNWAEQLETGIEPEALADLGKAIKSSTDVSARLIGLDRKNDHPLQGSTFNGPVQINVQSTPVINQ
jgi:transposase-like protein